MGGWYTYGSGYLVGIIQSAGTIQGQGILIYGGSAFTTSFDYGFYETNMGHSGGYDIIVELTPDAAIVF